MIRNFLVYQSLRIWGTGLKIVSVEHALYVHSKLLKMAWIYTAVFYSKCSHCEHYLFILVVVNDTWSHRQNDGSVAANLQVLWPPNIHSHSNKTMWAKCLAQGRNNKDDMGWMDRAGFEPLTLLFLGDPLHDLWVTASPKSCSEEQNNNQIDSELTEETFLSVYGLSCWFTLNFQNLTLTIRLLVAQTMPYQRL